MSSSKWTWSASHNDNYYIAYDRNGVQSYFFSRGNVIPVQPYPTQRPVQIAQQSSMDRSPISNDVLISRFQTLNVGNGQNATSQTALHETSPPNDAPRYTSSLQGTGTQHSYDTQKAIHSSGTSSTPRTSIYSNHDANIEQTYHPSPGVSYSSPLQSTSYSTPANTYAQQYSTSSSSSSDSEDIEYGDHNAEVEQTYHHNPEVSYSSPLQSTSYSAPADTYTQHTTSAIPQALTASNLQSPAKVLGSTFRRLVICCDGTQNSPVHKTNVRKIYDALYEGVQDSGFEQLKLYVEGVGTQGGWYSKYRGGAYGEGLEANIADAYLWVCENHTTENDEVIIVGFSRGAFTAHCLAHLLNEVGLLDPDLILDRHKTLVDWWRHFHERKGEHFTRSKCLSKVAITQEEFRRCRIRALALFDTVAAVDREGLWTKTPERLSFVKGTIPGNVRCAFHALALHEQRYDFLPSIWRNLEPVVPPNTVATVLVKQCWFAGFHTYVGGHEENTGATHIHHFSLLWMMGQLERWLAFDSGAMVRQILDDMQVPLAIKPKDKYSGWWKVRGKGKRDAGHATALTSPTLGQQEADLIKLSPGVRVHWTAAMHLSWLRTYGLTCLPLGEASRPLAGLWDTQRYWNIAGAQSLPEESPSQLENKFLEAYALRFGMDKAIELVIKVKLGIDVDNGA